jgi:hypothetical protein
MASDWKGDTFMRRIARIALPAACLLLLAAPARAEERKYRFEFFGGVSRPLDKDFEVTAPQSTFPLSGTHEFSIGARGGVRIGIDGARHWGQDYTYSYGVNASKVVNHTTGNEFSFTNRMHEASTNVLFYPVALDRSVVQPFVTGGLGVNFVTLGQSALNEAIDPRRAGLGRLEREIVFTINAGAGVRVRMGDRYSVRVDVRDYISRALRYGLPAASSDPNAPVFPVTGAFHQLVGTLGVVIHF